MRPFNIPVKEQEKLILAVSSILSLILFAYMFVNQFLFNSTWFVLVDVIFMFLSFAPYLIFKKTKSWALTSNLLVLLGYLIVYISVVLTGGKDSPVLIYVFMCPIICIVLVELLYLKVWIGISIITYIFTRIWGTPFIVEEMKISSSHLTYFSDVGFFGISVFIAGIIKFAIIQFEKINRQLQEKEDTLNLLLKVLFHDISHPVTLIESICKKYESEKYDEAAKRELRHKLRQANNSISEVLNHARNFYLLNENVQLLPIDNFDVEEMVYSSKFIFEDHIEAKSIDFLIEKIGDRDLNLKTNKVIFENQILNNIISNAIKYSPIGGKIRVVLYRKESNVVIEIIDQGLGISTDVIAALEERIPLISQKGTLGELGHGHGLTLVKTYVKLLGGSLEFASSRLNLAKRQEGTKVTLIFRSL